MQYTSFFLPPEQQREHDKDNTKCLVVHITAKILPAQNSVGVTKSCIFLQKADKTAFLYSDLLYQVAKL